MRAHEGAASGGHAAIRFGEDVYDFQHDGGVIAPRRENAQRFQHVYRALQNRSIERSRVAVSPETFALLRDAFERRLLAQTRQLEIARDLESDAALLAALAAGAPAAVPVRGAGFFAPAPREADAPALGELRARVLAAHGPALPAARDAEARRRLRDVPLAPPVIDAIALAPDAYPAGVVSVSRGVAQALAARRAVALLETPHALAPEVLAADAGVVLDPALAASLGAARAALVEAAVRLAQSRRPDWGEAFLLAAARVVAIDASLASGRLRTLDALPADARRIPVTERRRALLPALLAESREELSRALEALHARAAGDDASLAQVEAAVSRVAALVAATQAAPALRVAPGTLVPQAFAPVAVEPRPHADAVSFERAHAETAAASAAYRRRLEARYGYDLVRRNCVTEIFRTVEAGVAAAAPRDDVAALRAEAERRLGGRVDPVAWAAFVPFVSERRVRSTWHVAEHARLDSARQHAVARDGSLVAHLRESNVWTATTHAPGDDAGFFVFFTDGAPWLRPLLGAFNLGAALLRSGVGVATLPFDAGAGVRAGLDGAFWSVPELFFANVRKGGNEWVDPELRPPAE